MQEICPQQTAVIFACGLATGDRGGIQFFASPGMSPRPIDAETTPLRDPEHYQYHLDLCDVAEVWRRGSVIAPWLRYGFGGHLEKAAGK